MKGNIIGFIFNAVGLAMGIAVLVLSILKQMEVNTAITLLSIGTICTAVSLFRNGKSIL